MLLKKLLNKTTKSTSKNNRLQINLALNYGAKDEILRSLKLIQNKNENRPPY